MRIPDRIEETIVEAYGSASQPDWSFVERRYASMPYRELESMLREVGPIEETTDLNDDVALVLYIPNQDGTGLCIRLSLVGRFACVNTHAGAFLSREQLKCVENGTSILNVLDNSSVTLLNPDALRTQITFSDGHQTLYSVLFSSDEAIA